MQYIAVNTIFVRCVGMRDSIILFAKIKQQRHVGRSQKGQYKLARIETQLATNVVCACSRIDSVREFCML